MRFVDYVVAARTGRDMKEGDWRILSAEGSIVTVEEDGITCRYLMVDWYDTLGFGG